jgi:hypothetical protein
MQLSANVTILVLAGAQAAGDANYTGASGVDMQGYDGVLFVALFGTLTADQKTSLSAQGSSTAINSGYAAFATPAVTPAMADADSGKALVLDIYRPQTRYVQPIVDRGTANAVINGVIAILYSGDKLPAVPDTSISQMAQFVSP